VAPPTGGRSRHATRDTPPARPDDAGDRDVPAGRTRGGRTTAAAAFGHDTDRPARTAGALFDDTPARRHDDHSTPPGATGPVVTAAESSDRSARRHRGGVRSTLDDADLGADGASRVRRDQQTSPTSGSTPDDAEESADRRGGHRRIEAVADAAEPAGRRAVRGPDAASDDTGQRVTGADAFRRARSTPDDDGSRPTEQGAASDRAEPSGDRRTDVEPDIDKLGLADLLAGAMAAYRGL
jgi:hypothetical protein